jgi:hypothetical protein
MIKESDIVCGCGTYSVNLREANRLWVFKNSRLDSEINTIKVKESRKIIGL